MKTVYRARHLADAYLVQGLLKQHAIESRIDGEYLAGGMGELPVSDLIRLRVGDSDAEAAERLIAAMQNGRGEIDTEELTALAVATTPTDEGATHRQGPAPRSRHIGWPLLGLLLLLLLLALLFPSK